MIPLALLRLTARQTWTQPALLFVLLLQLLILGVLGFGLQLTYQSGELVGMRFFTLMLEEPLFFIRSSLPPLIGLSLGLWMFLFIVGTGSLYTEYLADPLLDLVLTRLRSRTLFLISRLCGIWLTFLLDILVFVGSLWALLFWKTGGASLSCLFAGGLLFFLQCAVMSGFCTLLGILIEQTTGVIILGLVLHFLLGSIGGLVDSEHHPVWKVVTLFLPQTSELNRMTLGAFFGEVAAHLPLAASGAQIVLCTTIAVVLFRIRDV